MHGDWALTKTNGTLFKTYEKKGPHWSKAGCKVNYRVRTMMCGQESRKQVRLSIVTLKAKN